MKTPKFLKDKNFYPVYHGKNARFYQLEFNSPGLFRAQVRTGFITFEQDIPILSRFWLTIVKTLDANKKVVYYLNLNNGQRQPINSGPFTENELENRLQTFISRASH